MPYKYVNRAWMTTATTGTGSVVLGSAKSGYMTFAEAGMADTDSATYCIRDGANFEIGVGTYTAAGTEFSRDTVIVSKISGTVGTSKINLSGSAEIFLDQPASELFRQAIDAVFTVGTIELGHASDTTIARSAAGVITVEGVEIVTVSRTQTLTNKTLTTPALTDPVITGAITEDIFTITDAAGFEIDPGNGTIQDVTLGASRTPKATNFANGESIVLRIKDGTAFTITWTDATFGGSGVIWTGGSAPTLDTTNWTVIVLWKQGGQIYGKYIGTVA